MFGGVRHGQHLRCVQLHRRRHIDGVDRRIPERLLGRTPNPLGRPGTPGDIALYRPVDHQPVHSTYSVSQPALPGGTSNVYDGVRGEEVAQPS
jgi:hypothetical protein